MGAVAALLQPLSGDFSARQVAREQPVKLAAMEGHFRTERGAPLDIGGWPDEEARETRYAIQIPHGLSLLAFHDFERRGEGSGRLPARGLAAGGRRARRLPGDGRLRQRPGRGGRAGRVARLAAAAALPDQRWFLRLLVACGPLGFIALEAGWTVTEVGRQPWIIHGVMRTKDAVTPMPHLVVPLVMFTLLYVFLGFVVVYMLRRQVFESPQLVAPTPAPVRPRKKA